MTDLTTVHDQTAVSDPTWVDAPTSVSEQPEVETKPLSDRDMKIAYQRALKERKEAIKRNKDMVADLELEVAYWKAQSDLLKYRYEKMDYYLKNLELEPRYQAAVEAEKERMAQAATETVPQN